MPLQCQMKVEVSFCNASAFCLFAVVFHFLVNAFDVFICVREAKNVTLLLFARHLIELIPVDKTLDGVQVVPAFYDFADFAKERIVGHEFEQNVVSSKRNNAEESGDVADSEHSVFRLAGVLFKS